jgi:hypothetical protein
MRTQGRCAEDHDSFWAEPPGVWWKWETVDLGDGGPSVTRWMVRPPCGHSFMLAPGGKRTGPAHEVDEHDDGMVTVEPKPGNSNSILCACGWHGYIDHGVWRGV